MSEVKTIKRKPRFTVITRTTAEPMPGEQQQAANTRLARLVARAFAADHPDLFGPRLPEVLPRQVSEPTPEAAVYQGGSHGKA